MAADSGRLREVYAPAHTGSRRYPSNSSYRVAKRSSERSLARPPCPQVPQSHLRVAKQSSIGPSARRPCPEVSQRHLRVADHHPTDLKTVSFRCHNRSSARPPRPEVSQSHPRVAKRSSIRHSARQTCPQVPQRHHPVAVSNRSFTCARP